MMLTFSQHRKATAGRFARCITRFNHSGLASTSRRHGVVHAAARVKLARYLPVRCVLEIAVLLNGHDTLVGILR